MLSCWCIHWSHIQIVIYTCNKLRNNILTWHLQWLHVHWRPQSSETNSVPVFIHSTQPAYALGEGGVCGVGVGCSTWIYPQNAHPHLTTRGQRFQYFWESSAQGESPWTQWAAALHQSNWLNWSVDRGSSSTLLNWEGHWWIWVGERSMVDKVIWCCISN